MGFPAWTLWGMAVATLGALIAIALSFIGQSPRFARRFGLAGYRLDLRVRALTGYGLALLLLALGFFLAGVPLGAPGPAEPTAVADLPALDDVAVPTARFSPTPSRAVAETALPVASETPRLTPESGAFGLRPPSATPEPDEESPPTATPSVSPDEATPETAGTARPPTATPTTTPTPSVTPVPTETPTPSPTATATPTMTPTPIEGITAVIDTTSSTLWVRRTPGGSQLALLFNGDRVIVLDGHANQGGRLWQEVSTLDGQVGWVLLEFLNFDTS